MTEPYAGDNALQYGKSIVIHIFKRLHERCRPLLTVLSPDRMLNAPWKEYDVPALIDHGKPSQSKEKHFAWLCLNEKTVLASVGRR